MSIKLSYLQRIRRSSRYYEKSSHGQENYVSIKDFTTIIFYSITQVKRVRETEREHRECGLSTHEYHDMDPTGGSLDPGRLYWGRVLYLDLSS